MITIEIARGARPGTIFYHKNLRGSDKLAMRARVNGKCQTWKTRPTEFRLPMKHGLRDTFQLTERNAMDWCTTDPTNKK